MNKGRHPQKKAVYFQALPELAKYVRAPSGEFSMFDRCGEMTNIRYAPVWIHAMACF